MQLQRQANWREGWAWGARNRTLEWRSTSTAITYAQCQEGVTACQVTSSATTVASSQKKNGRRAALILMCGWVWACFAGHVGGRLPLPMAIYATYGQLVNSQLNSNHQEQKSK